MMRVLGRRVLVERERVDDTVGRIVIPEKYRATSQIGVVRAVGPTVTTVVPGDKVLFGRYAGLPATVEGVECVLLWETDLMGIIS